MPASPPQREPSSSPLFSTPVLLVLMIGLALAGGIWYLERSAERVPKGPVLTAEAKSYVRHLSLSDVSMKATENAIGQQVVEIVGKIENKGDRVLKSVAVYCIFFDAYGQVVLRERVEIVRAKLGGLKPGETKPFRLPFDNLPQSWNRAMPQLVIAGIVFG
ncbi:MAG: DUF3426 domain-containing protein [Bryobacteraceae bacterium]|nr:DUF3426 domain-containing protein [Bryobacteraceae bacterium]MDW8380149.1 DUF3426 domain-containing protein [Bryobacterales bacterium]